MKNISSIHKWYLDYEIKRGFKPGSFFIYMDGKTRKDPHKVELEQPEWLVGNKSIISTRDKASRTLHLSKRSDTIGVPIKMYTNIIKWVSDIKPNIVKLSKLQAAESMKLMDLSRSSAATQKKIKNIFSIVSETFPIYIKDTIQAKKHEWFWKASRKHDFPKTIKIDLYPYKDKLASGEFGDNMSISLYNIANYDIDDIGETLKHELIHLMQHLMSIALSRYRNKEDINAGLPTNYDPDVYNMSGWGKFTSEEHSGSDIEFYPLLQDRINSISYMFDMQEFWDDEEYKIAQKYGYVDDMDDVPKEAIREIAKYRFRQDIDTILHNMNIDQPRKNKLMREMYKHFEQELSKYSSHPIERHIFKMATEKPSIEIADDEKKVFDVFKDTINKFKLKTTVRVAGGWVRDKLMGKESKDIDVAVDNMMGKEFAHYVDMYARSAGIEVSTGIIPAKPEQGKTMETAVVHIFGQEVEIVNLRDEEYDEKSRTPVTVLTDSPLKDAYRRDFTINSLFYNINSGELEDFTGKGKADIENHILRTPVPPPEVWEELGVRSAEDNITPKKTFLDDPLRVLRAIRFANRYGFDVDPELADAAKDPEVQAAFRQKISRERIEIELRKIMSEHKSPRYALELIRDWGYRSEALQLPDEYEEWELDQNNPNHELTVWGHLMEALDNIYEITKSKDISKADRYILNWSTFLHDVGKLDPSIRGTKQVGDKINSTFHGHEESSMKAAEYLLRNLPGTRVEEIGRIQTLIDAARRMNPQHQNTEEIANIKNKALGKILRLTNKFEQDWERAMEVAIADSSAHKKDWISSYPMNYWDSLKQKFEAMPKETATMGPLLSGNELMQLFSRKGGPWLGKLNAEMIEWQMDNPSATKEQAVGFAKQLYTSQGLDKMSALSIREEQLVYGLSIRELDGKITIKSNRIEDPEFYKPSGIHNLESQKSSHTISHRVKEAGQIDIPRSLAIAILKEVNDISMELVETFLNRIDVSSVNTSEELKKIIKSSIPTSMGVLSDNLFQLDISDTGQYNSIPWLANIISRSMEHGINALSVVSVIITDSVGEPFVELPSDLRNPHILHFNLPFSNFVKTYILQHHMAGPQAASGTIDSWMKYVQGVLSHELVHIMQGVMTAANHIKESIEGQPTRNNGPLQFGIPNKFDEKTFFMYGNSGPSLDINTTIENIKQQMGPLQSKTNDILYKLESYLANITDQEAQAMGVDHKDIMLLSDKDLDKLSKLRADNIIKEDSDLSDYIKSIPKQSANLRSALSDLAKATALYYKKGILHTMSDIEFFAILKERTVNMLENLMDPVLYQDEAASLKEKFPKIMEGYARFSGQHTMPVAAQSFIAQTRISKVMNDPVIKILKEKDPNKYKRLVKELYVVFDKIIDDLIPKKPLEQRQVSLREKVGPPSDVNPWKADDGADDAADVIILSGIPDDAASELYKFPGAIQGNHKAGVITGQLNLMPGLDLLWQFADLTSVYIDERGRGFVAVVRIEYVDSESPGFSQYITSLHYESKDPYEVLDNLKDYLMDPDLGPKSKKIVEDKEESEQEGLAEVIPLFGNKTSGFTMPTYKRGADESKAGIFIRLPKELSKQFPSLGEHDDSPPHITTLYIGVVPKKHEILLEEIVKRVAMEHDPFPITLDDKVTYFPASKSSDGCKIAKMEIVSPELKKLHKALKKAVLGAEMAVDDHFPNYKPHTTLEYMKPPKEKYDSKIPIGSCIIDSIEIWKGEDRKPIPLGRKKKAFQLSQRGISHEASLSLAGWWLSPTGTLYRVSDSGHIGFIKEHSQLFSLDEQTEPSYEVAFNKNWIRVAKISNFMSFDIPGTFGDSALRRVQDALLELPKVLDVRISDDKNVVTIPYEDLMVASYAAEVLGSRRKLAKISSRIYY